MKLTLPTKELRDALAKLASIPGAYGASPYTQAIRFEAGMAGLTLTRFTAEARISVTLDCAEIAEDDGTPAADHGALSVLVSRLPHKLTVLSSDGKHLHFVSGSAKAKLAIFSEEDEALPPEPEEHTQSLRLPIDDLRACFSYAAQASSRDTNKSHLCGVCLRMIGGKLAFIGTDGRRGYIATVPHELAVDCIVATPGVEAILKALASEVGACALSVGENTIAITGSNVELSLALHSETFPNIAPVIQQPEPSIKSKITADKEELTAALNTCAAIGFGDARLVEWEYADDCLQIRANNRRDSQMEIAVPCRTTAPFKCGVAATQLATALSGMTANDDGTVEIVEYAGCVLITQQDRIAFVALTKTN